MFRNHDPQGTHGQTLIGGVKRSPRKSLTCSRTSCFVHAARQSPPAMIRTHDSSPHRYLTGTQGGWRTSADVEWEKLNLPSPFFAKESGRSPQSKRRIVSSHNT